MVDFYAVKQAHSIGDVAKLLSLSTTDDHGKLRAPCPSCKAGGDRALVITPEKNLYFCFNQKKGGDQLALVSHILGLSIKESAQYILDHTGEKKEEPKETWKPHGLEPLKNLDHDHELVKTLGLETIAQLAGIGYCVKGLMRSHVAIPIRLPDGKLIGYIGVKEAKVPKEWKL